MPTVEDTIQAGLDRGQAPREPLTTILKRAEEAHQAEEKAGGSHGPITVDELTKVPKGAKATGVGQSRGVAGSVNPGGVAQPENETAASEAPRGLYSVIADARMHVIAEMEHVAADTTPTAAFWRSIMEAWHHEHDQLNGR